MGETPMKRETMLTFCFVAYGLLLAGATLWMVVGKIDLAPSLIPRTKDFALGSGVGAATSLLSWLSWRVGGEWPVIKELKEFSQQKMGPLLAELGFWDICLTAVSSGFCEEIFFRGIIQTQFGLVGASILFGFLHFPGPRYIAYVAFAVLAGFLFGYLYQATGSLWTPVCAHVLHNWICLSIIRHGPQSEND